MTMCRRKCSVGLVALVATALVASDLPQAPARPSRYRLPDAAAEPGVAIAGTFPENTHPPIHPIALTAGAANSDAEALLAFIKSAKAKPLFEALGFTVLGARRS